MGNEQLEGLLNQIFNLPGSGAPEKYSQLLEELEKFVAEFGPDLASEKPGRVGNTLLHAACLVGDEDIVRFLLESKANPNLKNASGDTPLLCAANSSRGREIVKILCLEVVLEDTYSKNDAGDNVFSLFAADDEVTLYDVSVYVRGRKGREDEAREKEKYDEAIKKALKVMQEIAEKSKDEIEREAAREAVDNLNSLQSGKLDLRYGEENKEGEWDFSSHAQHTFFSTLHTAKILGVGLEPFAEGACPYLQVSDHSAFDMMSDDQMDEAMEKLLPSSASYIPRWAVDTFSVDGGKVLQGMYFPQFLDDASKRSMVLVVNVDLHYFLLVAKKNPTTGAVDQIIFVDPAPAARHDAPAELFGILLTQFPGANVISSTSELQPVERHQGVGEVVTVINNNQCGKFCLFAAMGLTRNLLSVEQSGAASSSAAAVPSDGRLTVALNESTSFPIEKLDQTLSRDFAQRIGLCVKSCLEYAERDPSNRAIGVDLNYKALLQDLFQIISAPLLSLLEHYPEPTQPLAPNSLDPIVASGLSAASFSDKLDDCEVDEEVKSTKGQGPAVDFAAAKGDKKRGRDDEDGLKSASEGASEPNVAGAGTGELTSFTIDPLHNPAAKKSRNDGI